MRLLQQLSAFIKAFGVTDWEGPWTMQGEGGPFDPPQYAGWSLIHSCTPSAGSGFPYAAVGGNPVVCDQIVASVFQFNTFGEAAAVSPTVGQRVIRNWHAVIAQNVPWHWYERTAASDDHELMQNGLVAPSPYYYPVPAPSVDPRALPGGYPQKLPWKEPRHRPRDRLLPYQEPVTVVTVKPSSRDNSPPVVTKRPGVHNRVPDDKMKVEMPAWLFGLIKLYHVGTEMMDAFDCMFNALPAGVKGDHIPGSEWGHAKWTGYDKVERTLGNLDKVNWAAALRCMAANEIEDRVVGNLNRKLGKALSEGPYGGPRAIGATQPGRTMRGWV